MVVKILHNNDIVVTFSVSNFRLQEGTVDYLYCNMTFGWDDLSITEESFNNIFNSIQELGSDVVLEIFVLGMTLKVSNISLRANFTKKFITIGWEDSVWM